MAEKYKLQARDIYSSVKFLEKEGYLAYADAFFQPTKLMFVCDAQELYNFQVRNKKFDEPIKTILRTYGGLFQDFSTINEELLATRCKLSLGEFKSLLKKLMILA